MTVTRILAAALAATAAATAGTGINLAAGQAAAGPRIEITIAEDARAEATTGMVYVAVSRDNKRTPIEQAGPTGSPLFSLPVEGLQSGAAVAITAAERGHPIPSLKDLPAGEYWMQPFVNVYTRFARADGKTVWLHMDQWEGQNWKRSPGNIYGEPVKVQFDPRSSTPIRLIADKVIPPVQAAARYRSRQAHQDREQDPLEVVGTSHLPRRDDPAAERLRPASRRPLPGELRAGSLLAARSRRLRRGRRLRHILARRLDAADDLRHAPTPVAVLRRLLRRELGEQRTVRRRHPPGTDSGDRRPSSASFASPGRERSPADRRAAGLPPRTRSSIPTSTAARLPAAPTRSISGITRSSTSTRTRTLTSSTRVG